MAEIFVGWCSIGGLEATNESRYWNSYSNPMNFVLTRFVSGCMRARLTHDLEQFKKVVNNLGTLPEQDWTMEQMANFKCKDECEKAVVSVFRPEYTELFACKSKCQFENPHGLIGGVGSCLLDLETDVLHCLPTEI